MRFVIQRVTNASVTVDGNVTGEIDKGFLEIYQTRVTKARSLSPSLLSSFLCQLTSLK